jgi:hypothetical protein
MVDFGFFPVYDQISLWFREMVANNRRWLRDLKSRDSSRQDYKRPEFASSTSDPKFAITLYHVLKFVDSLLYHKMIILCNLDVYVNHYYYL